MLVVSRAASTTALPVAPTVPLPVCVMTAAVAAAGTTTLVVFVICVMKSTNGNVGFDG